MDMEDNKKRYLEKIVKWFVDDTVIDYDNRTWLPTYLENMTDFPVSLRPLGISKLSLFPLTRIYDHCRDTYGLNNDEIDYIWGKYSIIIIDKINNSKSINESVDRKNDYLDKVVDFLVEDTEYEIYVNRFSDHSETRVEIWFPSTVDDEPPYDYSIYDIRNWSNGSGWILDGGDDIDNVCSTYNICDTDTIQELYNRYIQKLSIIMLEEMELKNGDRINESVDRKNDYLGKIVDFLMDDTEVGTGWFNPPYYIGNGRSKAGRTGFKSVYLHTFGLLDYTTYSGLDSQLIYFNSFCKNNYGLTEEETKIVWERYMTKLYESYKWGF